MEFKSLFANGFSRRNLFQMGGVAAFGAFIPLTARAAGARDPRFITIVLRGALDGLTAVPPVGDPDYARLHGREAQTTSQPLPLNTMFGLHPAMPHFAAQYRAGQALVVHACASPYRDRSHFDGQDVLESGFTTPGHTDSGWMNRLLLTLRQDQRITAMQGLSVGTTTPLIIRGQADILGWAPSSLSLKDPDLPGRVLALYQESDPAFAATFRDAIKTNRITAGFDANSARGGPADPQMMAAMATGTAQFLARDDGPRIAALAFEGWDTHVSETDRLTRLLGGLDDALYAFLHTLGPVWKDTAILVITEFGRTAAINGTQGTDHGTGTTAFLTGGAVKGGRVIADWPGLKTAQLYQGRDLAPTIDLRSIAKGVMAELYDVSDKALATTIFSNSDTAVPMKGLIA